MLERPHGEEISVCERSYALILSGSASRNVDAYAPKDESGVREAASGKEGMDSRG